MGPICAFLCSLVFFLFLGCEARERDEENIEGRRNEGVGFVLGTSLPLGEQNATKERKKEGRERGGIYLT